jgi:niacin transporter
MSKQFNTRALVFAGLCVALGVVLPMAFHSLPDGGRIFLPMHIPVLLCGLLCGPWYGLGCGILAPLLSHLITGMPMAAALPGLLCELAVYGLAAGLAMKYIRTGKNIADLYISLGIAMILGRIAGGVASALFFMGNGEAYSIAIWASSYFVTAVPGIVAHLILVPALALTLAKAGVAPKRY